MRTITKGHALAAVLLILSFSCLAQTSKPASSSTSAAASKNSPTEPGIALARIFEENWDHTMQANPTWASQLGDRRWNDKWPDVSFENIKREEEYDRALLQRIKQFNRDRLTPKDQLSYDLFRQQLEESVEAQKFREYLIPVNQRGGIQTESELAEELRFDTVKDYEDWITRLKTFPTYMDQTIALMHEGLRTGAKHPKVTMQRIPAQIDKQLVATAEESGFYLPFKKFPATFSDADKQRLSAAAKAAIEQQVVPAYKKFKEFFVNEYLPGSYDQVGVWQWPNGAEYYAFTARKYTTTNKTPEEIHQLGLAEVTRIKAEMEKIKTQVGFKGTLQEFFTYLRTDPKFYYKTGDELLTAYRAIAKQIDPKLVKIFRTLPRQPYGVDPIPMSSAPDTTAAYYSQGAADGSRAGTYFVNLYKPEARPKWEMMALSLHESVPGHHLQIALAQELGEMPKFRRFGYYSAFGEGWGLYAESLGEDMGLYTDPYAKFGQLTYEMWRAVRLVVDTGMHQKHWTRQQAIDYFMQNAAKTELDVVNEIDRYIIWPGQALSYKMGELKIKELREKAKKEFGDRWNADTLRDFHAVVLSQGAVPLNFLERNVNTWIDANCPKACELPPNWMKKKPAASTPAPKPAAKQPAKKK